MREQLQSTQMTMDWYHSQIAHSTPPQSQPMIQGAENTPAQQSRTHVDPGTHYTGNCSIVYSIRVTSRVTVRLVLVKTTQCASQAGTMHVPGAETQLDLGFK